MTWNLKGVKEGVGTQLATFRKWAITCAKKHPTLGFVRSATWVCREMRPTKAPFFVVFFVGLAAIFYVCSQSWQPWIELLNGATWPAAATPPASAPSLATSGVNVVADMQSNPWNKFWFNVTLALRTMANFSGVFSAIMLILGYRYVKGASMYALTVKQIMKARDVSVSRKLNDALERNPLLGKDGSKFLTKVGEFGDEFERDELPALLNEYGLKKLDEMVIKIN